MKIGAWQLAAYENAKRKGFYNSPINVPERLALIHSEVSEALEDYRDGKMRTVINPVTKKPEGFPSELADIAIRLLDLAEAMGIDLEAEMVRKHEYNLTRPIKHGKVC